MEVPEGREDELLYGLLHLHYLAGDRRGPLDELPLAVGVYLLEGQEPPPPLEDLIPSFLCLRHEERLEEALLLYVGLELLPGRLLLRALGGPRVELGDHEVPEPNVFQVLLQGCHAHLPLRLPDLAEVRLHVRSRGEVDSVGHEVLPRARPCSSLASRRALPLRSP